MKAYKEQAVTSSTFKYRIKIFTNNPRELFTPIGINKKPNLKQWCEDMEKATLEAGEPVVISKASLIRQSDNTIADTYKAALFRVF